MGVGIIELQKSTQFDGMFRDFIPNKQLNDGWHYYSIGEFVLGVRLNITKTFQILDEKKTIQTKNLIPFVEWEHNTESVILTLSEYKKIIGTDVI